jgi:hypothetical protein
MTRSRVAVHPASEAHKIDSNATDPMYLMVKPPCGILTPIVVRKEHATHSGALSRWLFPGFSCLRRRSQIIHIVDL